MINLDVLEIEGWLALNAKLQQKKNVLRKALKEKGVLKKEGNNTFDKYKYFTEAQYKELFTELFSSCNLELKFNEIAYDTFEGSEKQANGRMPKLEFALFDCETGFFETTIITGEGIDKGDKAGYKGYTGTLKYYLANTFMVATGDDPEKESPDNKMNYKKPYKAPKPKIDYCTKEQLEILDKQDETLKKYVLEKFEIESLEKVSVEQADSIIEALKRKGALK